MQLKKTLQAIALCCSLAGIGSAHADPILFNNVDDTGSILYATTWQGASLSASVQFTLTSLSAQQAVFSVLVANNSSGPGKNTLTSFGIDVVTPTLQNATASGVWGAGTNVTLPGFQKVDLCMWPGNNCSGGSNAGLDEGEISQFTLTLTTKGSFLSNGISFETPYGVKFQTVGTGGKSYDFAGCNAGTPGCGGSSLVPSQVPEPASIALLGLGLLGATLARRRKA